MTDLIAHGMKSQLIHYFDNTLFAQARKMIKVNIGKQREMSNSEMILLLFFFVSFHF